MKTENSKGLYPVASLVLGIISIVTALFWFIALPAGILAIIFGVKSYRNFGSKLGMAGFITGIIGLALCLLIYISLIIIIILQNAYY